MRLGKIFGGRRKEREYIRKNEGECKKENPIAKLWNLPRTWALSIINRTRFWNPLWPYRETRTERELELKENHEILPDFGIWKNLRE